MREPQDAESIRLLQDVQRRPCRLPRSAPLNSRRQFYWIATVYSTAPRESDRGATALLSALEPAERASACINGRARKRIRELLSVRLMDPAIPTREHASLGAVPWRGPSAGSIICQDDGHGQRTLPEVQSGIQENGYCCPGPGPCDRAGAFQSSRWRADHVRAVLFWMLRI